MGFVAGVDVSTKSRHYIQPTSIIEKMEAMGVAPTTRCLQGSVATKVHAPPFVFMIDDLSFMISVGLRGPAGCVD